jgi:precorrin-2 dehydrogenase / sirohydrochlorin ferrochelatase
MPPKRPRSSPPVRTGFIEEYRKLRPEYYPAFLNLRGKKCIVVGGGKVAERKVAALIRAGACVMVISPELTAALERRRAAGEIDHIGRKYRKGDLKGAFVVIAATSSEEINRSVSIDAPLLVNVVDAPELCNFIAPAAVRRGPLAIAVSTGGASPAMAAAVRGELELLYGNETGRYLLFLGKLRKEAIKMISDRKLRETFLKQAASQEILGILRDEGFQKVKDKVMERLLKMSGQND